MNLLNDNDDRVKIAGADTDGIARGKIISKQKFLKIIKDGMGFCDVIFGWDCMDKLYTFETSTDFSDITAVPDLTSFRRIPWENGMPFFLLDFYRNKKRIEFAPRSLLKTMVEKCQKNDLKGMAGIEFEWYNFKENSETLHGKKGVDLEPLTHGMFGYSITRTGLNQDYFTQIYENCKNFGIPIEGIHTETGPGVYEVALEYTNVLEMADRGHLFKTVVKSIAQNHGITACFMAKPHGNLPGCSGHMHFSLQKDGGNIFASTVEGKLNPEMQLAVAGLLYSLPSMMAIYAPTINSYKRLVENYWAPVTVSYGFENRLSSLRIICPPYCEPEATRIEVRVPGADGIFLNFKNS
jgi:glutamine synthetase